MKNVDKKKLALTTALVLLPMVVGLALWSSLPEQMPIHFNMSGATDGWAPKWVAVFGMPLFLAVIHLITVVAVWNDPKKQDIGKQMMNMVLWTIPVISIVCNLAIYSKALGKEIDISMAISILVGLFFLFIGNYMTKNHQNYTVGIRLPWTLNSRENWNRTHRFASKLWMLAGVICILNGFVKSQWLMLAVLVAILVLPVAYSFILHKKGI